MSNTFLEVIYAPGTLEAGCADPSNSVFPSAVMAYTSSLESVSPVILQVLGAWHSPRHYSLLFDGLKQEGIHAICERNPSCDCTDPDDTSTVGDASAIRQSIISQLDKGLEVVIIMHSYGGCPGAVAQELSKSER